ncbi:MAG TPA: hydroxyethylthiazole kinase [Gemmatimonadaceae bacterium]|nr:hydroxyethylthiazole kinase [Gemmatimonadaceae bacterium]
MDLNTAAADTLLRLRERSPLVHNITNFVSMDIVANALLAVGASPLMAHAIEEVDEIVALTGAVVINIGTLSPEWVKAMEQAADKALALAKPWVLDPVGAGATSYRTTTSLDLAWRRPTIVRGNASEILALAGAERATKGVDSTRASSDARDAAESLARELGCVVAVTGHIDYVTDGARMLSVGNGHPMMARVTALGCTASALVGACVAVSPDDPLPAAAHALAIIGACGERAARSAAAPGSFRAKLVDALFELTPSDLRNEAKLGVER